MNRCRTTVVSLLLAGVASTVLGCSAEPAGPAASAGGVPASAAATPGAAVQSPSGPGWVPATVTRGGDGPCYAMVDPNGVEYAVYWAGGTKLTVGDRVRARFGPARLRIACGSGKPVQATAVEPAG